jgi:hypothetical protein
MTSGPPARGFVGGRERLPPLVFPICGVTFWIVLAGGSSRKGTIVEIGLNDKPMIAGAFWK